MCQLFKNAEKKKKEKTIRIETIVFFTRNKT